MTCSDGKPDEPTGAHDDNVQPSPGSLTVRERRAVNWPHFAIGKVSRSNWQHFRYCDGKWRHFGRLEIRAGKQEKLLELFLEGGGCLLEDDALRLWYEPKSQSQRLEILKKLEPEITHLRNLIRQARGIVGKTSDPLPRSKDDGPRRWIAAVIFGGAGHQDDKHVSSKNAMHFIAAHRTIEEKNFDD